METRIETWNGYDIRFVNLDGDWYAVLKDICDALKLNTFDVSRRIPESCMERVSIDVSVMGSTSNSILAIRLSTSPRT